MVSKNDVTGDYIKSKPQSNSYRDNWDKIFSKKEESVPVFVEPCDFNCGHKMIELSIVLDVFESDVKTIEYILGQNIESIRFVGDLVAYELISYILTDSILETPLELSMVEALSKFLIEEQVDRLNKVIEPLYGITYD